MMQNRKFVKVIYLFLHVVLSKGKQRQSLVCKNAAAKMGTTVCTFHVILFYLNINVAPPVFHWKHSLYSSGMASAAVYQM
jgi:hypothetical protein